MSVRFVVVHLQSKIKAVLQIIYFGKKDNIIQHFWSLKDTEIEIKTSSLCRYSVGVQRKSFCLEQLPN